MVGRVIRKPLYASLASLYAKLTGATFTGGVTVSTGAAAAVIATDANAGQVRGVFIRTAGSNRWGIYGGTGAESGSNAGSDLVIAGYSDAAGYLGGWLQIRRSDGAMMLGGVPSGGFKGAGTVNTKGSLYVNNVEVAAFPSGTGLLFPQTSAPTGWTKQTTHNDKALRIVSGTASSGGTLDFSAVMTTVASDNTTLGGGQNGTHTHDLTYDNASNTSTGGGQTRVTDLRNGGAGAKTATGKSAGASNPHFHNVDLRIKYVDAIIATKD